MKRQRVNLVLDVGANVGQYASDLRALGYRGRIVSFEPLEAAFGRLQARAADDPYWRCVHAAVGEAAGETVIHVAANSVSSSLLPMTSLHVQMAPESVYVRDETVPVVTLDEAAADPLGGGERVLLKMDVQGYELGVLRGAERLLESVCAVETEMSTRPLYEGQPLWYEVVDYLTERAFELSVLHEGIVDPDTGDLLQLDGVFVRSTSG